MLLILASVCRDDSCCCCWKSEPACRNASTWFSTSNRRKFDVSNPTVIAERERISFLHTLVRFQACAVSTSCKGLQVTFTLFELTFILFIFFFFFLITTKFPRVFSIFRCCKVLLDDTRQCLFGIITKHKIKMKIFVKKIIHSNFDNWQPRHFVFQRLREFH